MTRKLTQEQIEELTRCRYDCTYFVKTYGWLKHTTLGAVRWDEPYPYQEKLWRLLQDGKNVVVNKTRQIGCSWAVAAFAVWLIIFHPDVEVLFLSETERKAIRLLKNAHFFFDRLPNFLKPEVSQDTQTRFAVRFVVRKNGTTTISESSIDSLTTTGRSGASYSAALVVMDEAAHLPSGEQVFGAIMPATAHGGQAAVISTPGGMDNFFYRVWYEANHTEGGFVPLIAYWRDCGLTDEWFEAVTKGAGLTTQQILQEYELQFLPSGSPFFDVVQLEACYRPYDEYPELRDARGVRIDQQTRISFTGVDTAGGRKLRSGDSPDYHSFVTLNEWGVEIASWHSQDTPLEEVSGYVSVSPSGEHKFVEGFVTRWHRLYPGPMVIERWGPGDTVYLNHFQNAPNDDISYVIGRRTTAGMNAAGSKLRMLNALRLAIAGRQIVIRDPFTYYCLQTFSDKGGGKYEAADGAYDDPVIALALAYSELQRQGGLYLELPDQLSGGRRMVGINSDRDLDPDDAVDVLPVGDLMEGPVFEMAGDFQRETDEIFNW